jgi:hypothetical protein
MLRIPHCLDNQLTVNCEILKREREREIEFRGGSERHYQDVGGSKITNCVWKVPRRCPLVLLVG